MLFSKSQAAFTLSALKLFDEHPHVYFWTFTFTKVHCGNTDESEERFDVALQELRSITLERE